MPGTAPEIPPVRVPTLGIWSTNDHYLDGERMEKSGAYVEAPWRYEVIEGASHWIPLDAAGPAQRAPLRLARTCHGEITERPQGQSPRARLGRPTHWPFSAQNC